MRRKTDFSQKTTLERLVMPALIAVGVHNFCFSAKILYFTMKYLSDSVFYNDNLLILPNQLLSAPYSSRKTTCEFSWDLSVRAAHQAFDSSALPFVCRQ